MNFVEVKKVFNTLPAGGGTFKCASESDLNNIEPSTILVVDDSMYMHELNSSIALVVISKNGSSTFHNLNGISFVVLKGDKVVEVIVCATTLPEKT